MTEEAIAIWLGVLFIRSTAIARSRRLESMAWTFLMLSDADADRMSEVWLREPGRCALELEAMAMSREIRSRLSRVVSQGPIARVHSTTMD